MGENVVAAIPGLAKLIAGEGQHDRLGSKAVFFDALGYFMVRINPSKWHQHSVVPYGLCAENEVR